MSETAIELPQQPAIPVFLLKDVLAKLAYIDECVKSASVTQEGHLITLTVGDGVTPELRATLIVRVRELVTAMTDDAFEPDLKILEEHRGRGRAESDPMPTLLKAREVVEEGLGFCAIGPLMSVLIDYIDHRIAAIGAEMGAGAYRFPALMSPQLLEKVQYFKNFPHSLSFCTHLRESLPTIETFANAATVVDGRIKLDSNLYAPPPAMLSPTVCHHLYNTLSESRLKGRGITATAVGHCFRYESRNLRSLERLWNFTMREIVFVGEDAFVQGRLTEARTRMRLLMQDLDLTYSVITANDPFFIGTYRDQAAYQAAFDLKYEIRAKLPYKDDTLAVGSYNRHGDFFGRILAIENEDGSVANSGCFAVGLERLAFAFMAQHGTDPAAWPQTIQDAVRDGHSRTPAFGPRPQ